MRHMQYISFIFQQNIHLTFLQSLFICLCNLYFFSQLKNKKLLIIFLVISIFLSILYTWINFYATIFVWLILIFCNAKFLKSNIFHSVLNPTLAVFLLIFSDYIIEIFLRIFSISYLPHLLLRVIADFILASILAILMKRLLTRLSSNPNSETFKRILCAFLLFTVGIYYVLISMNRFLAESSIDFGVHVFLLLFYSCLSITLCTIALLTIRKQMNLKMKKIEMEQLLDYTQQLEQNYMDMRKFKHDYKNILISMEIFIKEGDMERLAQYYETYIRPTQTEIERNFSYLSDLSHVKVPEIKGILSSKFLRAQSLGIEMKFECREDISNFYIDSIILIRSLGILLDNAIEEVEANAKQKVITAACISYKGSIQIIIQNTCGENIPQIYEMKRESFSTKGKNRGLGLSNLEKLLSPLKNVILDTQYKDGQLTQIIEITKEEKYAAHSYL